MTDDAANALTAGWEQLADGDWAASRASFERAVAERESPEAFEGLSWAAWWLDDAATVFRARERAYHLYRERGDGAAAARMATWLAADQLDFAGATAIASGWLQRARRLLDPLEPGPDHGWLAFHEGYIANAGGDTVSAQRLAAAATEIGRRFGVPDLEMLGLALTGAALVASGRVTDGMRCLDEATATALAGEASIPISGAWACCFLVTACTMVQDYGRAFEWCDRIAEFSERYGSRYMLAFCRAEYGAVHLWRGRWDDADAMLQSSFEDYSATRPAWAEAPLVALAELRRRQGRLKEADELLEHASSSTAALLCRAQLSLDRGDAIGAMDLAERLLRQVPADRLLERVPALHVLVKARIATGALDEAAATVEALREAHALAGTPALLAGADLADGMLAAARGDHERARPLLEDAVDRFDRCEAPFESARARVELATSLVALGRAEEAEREATSAHRSLERLGADPESRRAGVLLGMPARAPASTLTARERDVLALLVDGLTNKAIADRLVVSEHTVHRHVTNILRKLDAPSRTAAAAYAIRADLLGDDPPA